MVRKRGILIVCLTISFLLIALALINFNFSNFSPTGKAIFDNTKEIKYNTDDSSVDNPENIPSNSDDSSLIKNKKSNSKKTITGYVSKDDETEKKVLKEYKPKQVNQEEIFLDKKFKDNGRYIISSLNEYSPEWYPSDSPKADLKKLIIELQVTDKVTGKNFSIKGTADIPKYYGGHFDFNTSLEDLVSFKDINPNFSWEYSEEYSILPIEKYQTSIIDEGKIKNKTFVEEKVFKNYKFLDNQIKQTLPKELFLDPDVSVCGSLNVAGATFDVTTPLTSTGTCLQITADNVTLDCHGYLITYSTSGTTNNHGIDIGVSGVYQNATIKNCRVQDGYWTTSTSSNLYRVGIYSQYANYSKFINNTLNVSNGITFYFLWEKYLNLTDNTVYGEYIGTTFDYVYNSTVLNHRATTYPSGSWGFRHERAVNNTLVNLNTTALNSNYGLWFQNSTNTKFINLRATSTSGSAIYIDISNNSVFKDCISITAGGSYDVAYNSLSGSGNNTFLNCSYTLSKESVAGTGNQLIRQWYYQAYANYTNGTSASGVNITARNSTNIIQSTANTSSTGWIITQNLTEYINNAGTRSFYNNYTINASLPGQSTISRPNYNLTVKQNNVTDFFTFTGTTPYYGWVVNTTINSSLPDVDVKSSPEVFYKDGWWYMIAGESDGILNGYVLAANGTTWLPNSTIVAGTPSLGGDAFVNPDVFYKDSSWYLIIGNQSNGGAGHEFFGYVWSGSQWVVNTTINASLDGYGDNAPAVYNVSNNWHLISGDYNSGTWWGYTWSGGTWVANSTVEAGLPAIGLRGTPEVFYKDSSLYMIIGQDDGQFFGFVWSGSQWVPNSTINASLPDIGDASTPTVFFKDENWFLISGAYDGRFYGYVYNQTYESGAGGDTTSPTITFESPTPSNTSSTTNPVTLVANISDASNTSSFIDFDKRLILWMSMENSAVDNSSYNWGPTNGGATFTSGKFGQALTGFTSSAHVDVSPSLDFASNNMTISFWMYVRNGAVPNRQNPLTKAYGGDGTFTVEPNGDINFYWGSYGGDGGSYTSHTSDFSYTNGTWEHWVMVRDRTGRTTQWYKNGVAGTPQSYTSTYDPLHSTNDLQIGYGYTGNSINGSMDEVLIFNRTLSSNEIKALYSSQINKFNTSTMNLSNGQHNYTVYAIDEYGNQASSGWRYFTISAGSTLSACKTSAWSSNTIYTLTQNVSSTGTCMYIDSQNVTLDCNGYWITYSSNDGNGEYGVYTNQDGTAIKNCNILDGYTSSNYNWRIGLYFDESNYSTSFNNTVNVHNSTAVFAYNVKYFNLTRTIGRSNEADGIAFSEIYNSSIVNNTGWSFDGGGSVSADGDGEGIVLEYAYNNTIFNNNGTSQYRGFTVGSYSTNNNFTNNWGEGGTHANDAGILIGTFSTNNTFINNTGRSDGTGIFFWAYSENNTLINNTGIATTLSGGAGVTVYNSSRNNFIGQTAKGLAAGSNGIIIIDSSHTLFRDCINITGVDDDVWVTDSLSYSSNNTFINCSINAHGDDEIVDTGNQLIRKWYYMAYVNYSNGTLASGANVTAYNTSNVIQFTENTGATGWITRKEVIEYINNGGTRTFWNNHTINATKAGSTTASNRFNFTITQNKIDDVLTLTGGGDTTSPTITFEEPPTPSNTSSTSNPVTLVANISDASNTSSWIDLDRSLLGYWAMDYYNATGIFDNSTYKNNATFFGGINYTNLTSGKRGQALSFNGTTQYLKVPNSGNLDFPISGTVNIWVNLTSVGSWDMPFWRGGSSIGEIGYDFELGTGPWYTGISNGTANIYCQYSASPLTGWHMLSFTFDTTTNKLTCYVDGTNTSSGVDISGFGGIDSSNDIYMGSIVGSYSINGSIDEVMIFNRSLSTTEIKALYSSQINKFNTSAMNLSNGQHNYTVYAIDEYGNQASSGWRYFTIGGDTTNPTYSDVSVNNTVNGIITKFAVNVNDNVALNPSGSYIFSTNNTGTWVNDSVVLFSTTPSWANVTKTLNSTVGIVVGYRWFFNDTAGNRNSTSVYTLTVTSSGGDTTPPTITFEIPTPSNTSSTTSPVTIIANISDESNTSSFMDFDRTLRGYWSMDYYNTTGI
ncbi:MAG: LamG-like jellyroll fold domain-containing protein, partial [Nanobdellota archaeon]